MAQLRAYIDADSITMSAIPSVTTDVTASLAVLDSSGTPVLQLNGASFTFSSTEDVYMPGGNTITTSLTSDQITSLQAVSSFSREDAGVVRYWFERTQLLLFVGDTTIPMRSETRVLGFVEGIETVDVPVDGSFPPKLDLFTLGEGQVINQKDKESQEIWITPNDAARASFGYPERFDAGANAAAREPIPGALVTQSDEILSGHMYFLSALTEPSGRVLYKVRLISDYTNFSLNLSNVNVSDNINNAWDNYNFDINSLNIKLSWQSNSILGGKVAAFLADLGDDGELRSSETEVTYASGETGRPIGLISDDTGVGSYRNSATPMDPAQIPWGIRIPELYEVFFKQGGVPYDLGVLREAYWNSDTSPYYLPLGNSSLQSAVTSTAGFVATDTGADEMVTVPTTDQFVGDHTTAQLSFDQLESTTTDFDINANTYTVPTTGLYRHRVDVTVENPLANNSVSQPNNAQASAQLFLADMAGRRISNIITTPFNRFSGETVKIGGTNSVFQVNLEAGQVIQAVIGLKFERLQASGLPNSVNFTVLALGRSWRTTLTPSVSGDTNSNFSNHFITQQKSLDLLGTLNNYLGLKVIPQIDGTLTVKYKTNQENVINIDSWIDRSVPVERSYGFQQFPKTQLFQFATDADIVSQIMINNNPNRQFGTYERVEQRSVNKQVQPIEFNLGPVVPAGAAPLPTEVSGLTVRPSLVPTITANGPEVMHLYSDAGEGKRRTITPKPRIGYRWQKTLTNSFYLSSEVAAPGSLQAVVAMLSPCSSGGNEDTRLAFNFLFSTEVEDSPVLATDDMLFSRHLRGENHYITALSQVNEANYSDDNIIAKVNVILNPERLAIFERNPEAGFYFDGQYWNRGEIIGAEADSQTSMPVTFYARPDYYDVSRGLGTSLLGGAAAPTITSFTHNLDSTAIPASPSTSVTFTVLATDPDGDALTYTLYKNNIDAGLTPTEITGGVTFTTTALPGDQFFVAVTDGDFTVNSEAISFSAIQLPLSCSIISTGSTPSGSPAQLETGNTASWRVTAQNIQGTVSYLWQTAPSSSGPWTDTTDTDRDFETTVSTFVRCLASDDEYSRVPSQVQGIEFLADIPDPLTISVTNDDPNNEFPAGGGSAVFTASFGGETVGTRSHVWQQRIDQGEWTQVQESGNTYSLTTDSTRNGMTIAIRVVATDDRGEWSSNISAISQLNPRQPRISFDPSSVSFGPQSASSEDVAISYSDFGTDNRALTLTTTAVLGNTRGDSGDPPDDNWLTVTFESLPTGNVVRVSANDWNPQDQTQRVATVRAEAQNGATNSFSVTQTANAVLRVEATSNSAIENIAAQGGVFELTVTTSPLLLGWTISNSADIPSWLTLNHTSAAGTLVTGGRFGDWRSEAGFEDNQGNSRSFTATYVTTATEPGATNATVNVTFSQTDFVNRTITAEADHPDGGNQGLSTQTVFLDQNGGIPSGNYTNVVDIDVQPADENWSARIQHITGGDSFSINNNSGSGDGTITVTALALGQTQTFRLSRLVITLDSTGATHTINLQQNRY